MTKRYRLMPWALIVLLAAVALSGCAPVKKTQFMVRNQCLTRSMPTNGDAYDIDCAPRNEVCDAYYLGEALEGMTRSQCLDHCKATEREQLGLHPADGCEWLIRRTRDQCDQYCLGKPVD